MQFEIDARGKPWKYNHLGRIRKKEIVFYILNKANLLRVKM